jgi:catechol 2,3-dioxygenase-like lactoylglutathione lyase family enzyme
MTAGDVQKSLKNVGAITLFVEDLDESRGFYRDVLGLPLVFQDDASAAFSLGSFIVNLLAVPAARELIEPAEVAGPGAGARFQLTIETDDVDAAAARLSDLGVTLINGPMDRAWGLRTACFADPAGHVWEIAAPLRPAG